MKYIPFNDSGELQARELLKVVCRTPQEKGANYEEIMRRCRIIDLLDKLPADAAGISLEDADHAFLKGIITTFRFNVADPALLRIINDVVEAKEPLTPS